MGTLPLMGNSAADVLAQNLKALMEDERYKDRLGSQVKLGAAAGVDQKTVGNCLNPALRLPSPKGRVLSPTIASVEKIAAVFGLQAWELLRPQVIEQPQVIEPMPEEVPA